MRATHPRQSVIPRTYNLSPSTQGQSTQQHGHSKVSLRLVTFQLCISIANEDLQAKTSYVINTAMSTAS